MANFQEIDNDDIFEDDFDIIEIIDYGFPRQIYRRSEHFDTLDILGFYKRFRLTKETCLNLLVLIEDEIEHVSDM
ncbi:hypothetical protein RN001_010189 [Aquatica leii]|uniref:Uncharacterized protein n=1 Tax=Aquatica leii TaxID=1421715 RepID=A0AAN7QHB3_9COLE|nr:hypothetical protein RN001_010189 [Aquatica leii]